MDNFTKIPYSELPIKKIGRLASQVLDLNTNAADADLIIIIPSFAEEDLERVLLSLDACDRADVKFEVIVLINESESVESENQNTNLKSFNDVISFSKDKCFAWDFHVIYVTEIPTKIAGVGTARKLAMDEAAFRFQKAGKLDTGIIVNLDADCTVSSNYITSIFHHFRSHPSDELVSIAFEHRIEELDDPVQKKAIQQYESYLHYFIGMQRRIGLPYAYQTIGSAFAVRAGAYLQVGGMNRRKAGEDFYFIHKFTKKGTLADLNKCTVYPSGRSSFRVPFGTGKAVADMLDSKPEYDAYHPQSFYDLAPLVSNVNELYNGKSEQVLEKLPTGLKEYLLTQQFEVTIGKLRNNTSNLTSFAKAFYQWFDAFRLMKYLHFVREKRYPSVPVDEAIKMMEL